MTCREKLKKEHPDYIGNYVGGCLACPDDYGYMDKPDTCDGHGNETMCDACWSRSIPIGGFDWTEIQNIVNNAMSKRDRQVHLYFHPSNGVSVNISPWPDADELYEQYEKGRITPNDFRVKMGLERVEMEEAIRARAVYDNMIHFKDHE